MQTSIHFTAQLYVSDIAGPSTSASTIVCCVCPASVYPSERRSMVCANVTATIISRVLVENEAKRKIDHGSISPSCCRCRRLRLRFLRCSHHCHHHDDLQRGEGDGEEAAIIIAITRTCHHHYSHFSLLLLWSWWCY